MTVATWWRLSGIAGLIFALCANSWAGSLAGVDISKVAPVKRLDPKYPRGALARGIEGAVVVEFVVDAKGGVIAPRIVEGTPPGVFDAAAINAVSAWKYPALGTVSRPVQVRFEFKTK